MIENSGLCLKIKSAAISIVSCNGTMVKRFSTSKETKNLFLKSKLLSSSSTKEKESSTDTYQINTEQEVNLNLYLAKL